MKKTHIVVSLYLSGKGKKIFKSGDHVESSDLNNFSEALAGGYIRPLDEEEPSTPASKEPAPTDEPPILDLPPVDGDASQEPAPTKVPLFIVERDGELVDVFEEKDIHKTEIIAILEQRGVEFDSSERKSILWDLLTAK